MPLLVTGSIGIDTVKTPFGESENCLGGSAVYFSYTASFFSPVRFVGVIGPDCPFKLADIFKGKDVDLTGLEVRENSKTFRWSGTYYDDMDDRTTDYLELNVLAEAPPKVPGEFNDSKFVFLANTAPNLQLELLEQINKPTFVAADTMNYYIENNLAHLKLLLKRIDCLVINEDEAKLLACEKNLIKAGKNIIEMGPKYVLIKKGQAGSLLCCADGDKFILPAYPVENVMDPTGAGDSFAGGFMGHLAQKQATDAQALKEAIAYGTVTASFTIEGFSLNGLSSITRDEIDSRYKALKEMTNF